MRDPDYSRTLSFLAIGLAVSSCSRIETAFTDTTRELPPHEAYSASLERAGLEGTPLVSRWKEAAAVSIREPLSIDPPFREVAFFPGEEPSAVAYLVSLERGQVLQATLDMDPADTVGVFLDVFERQEAGGLRLVASASRGSRQIEFEPPGGGTFVLRVQPELLRSVRVTLSVLRAASLAFPVHGRHPRDIGSRFGVSREGGRRNHHGVDIFASRGTPVVAATSGRVSRVEKTNLGGLVVWLRDDRRRQSFYYAHLDRQLVRRGDRVDEGDTLGLVGNTGNARTTPPHLHFGIYVRGEGPVDPYSYVAPPRTRPPALQADSAWLGDWVRLHADALISGPDAPIIEGGASGAPSSGSGARETGLQRRSVLPRHTVVRVVGAFGRHLRVRLPDGRQLAVQDASLESMDEPIEELILTAAQPAYSRPTSDAVTMGELSADEPFPVVGRFGPYWLIRPELGPERWVAPTP